ncbi:hypothetical protein PsYK624_009170 [Phanerochaete sordida]|uniref:Uncharacterized protein n=1 Tax=Phanerochaete sordida TaxID=48140 RepID=A0A9P3FYE3_9APHY|nr:hypothetical protein PsYK624_009170 [Phanerochaete sordida]
MDDHDVPDSPPPPAYEFCQEEYDRKVSHALETSQAEASRENEETDEWEVWSEDVFATAAAILNISDADAPCGAASSSTSYPRSPPPADTSVSSSNTAASARGQTPRPPSPVPGNGKAKSDGREDALDGDAFGSGGGGVQPLRIVKKAASMAPSGSAKEKERPSWLAEAQLDAGPPHAAAPSSAGYRAQVWRNDSIISRTDTPPPAFTPVGQSLDGPPYEGPGVVMTYTQADSRSASPLHSPVATQTSFVGAPFAHPPPAPPLQASPPARPYTHARSASGGRRMLPQPPQQLPQPQAVRPLQSFSPPPAVQPTIAEEPAPPPPRRTPLPSSGAPRPMTTYTAHSVYSGPRVAFDPKLAYTNARSSAFDIQQEPMPTKVNAAALYSSAVSSLYSSGAPSQPSRMAPSTRSTTSLNPYSTASSTPYSNTLASQSMSSYHLPQAQTTVPHAPRNYIGPNREAMKSPAPSELSIASSSQHSASSPYASIQAPGRYGYQQSHSRPGTGYQATSYQPTSYRPSTPQQNTPYQAASTAYQPTTYQNTYQPTSY